MHLCPSMQMLQNVAFDFIGTCHYPEQHNMYFAKTHKKMCVCILKKVCENHLAGKYVQKHYKNRLRSEDKMNSRY